MSCMALQTNYNVNDKLKPDVWLEPCQAAGKCVDMFAILMHSAFGTSKHSLPSPRGPQSLAIDDSRSGKFCTGLHPYTEVSV